MSTLLDLKTKIAGDLHRSDLSTQISAAVESAVKHYERLPFWFLEGRAELTTSAGQRWYSPPPNLKGFDSLLVKVSGSDTPLDRTDYVSMDEEDSGILTGIPCEWSFYQDNIRLYPPPDTTYVLTLSYRRHIDVVSNSASVSWTNEGFDLIRHRADWDIYAHHLRNPEMAATAKNSEMETLESLTGESNNKRATGKIKKGSW